MKGLSPRNLKYMRACAAGWPARAIVQDALAQIPWYHHVALLEKLHDPAERLWYARQEAEHGWSHNILVLQIDGRAHRRQGKATSNFRDGTADPRREREIEHALVAHIQRLRLELGTGFAFGGRRGSTSSPTATMPATPGAFRDPARLDWNEVTKVAHYSWP